MREKDLLALRLGDALSWRLHLRNWTDMDDLLEQKGYYIYDDLDSDRL